MRFFTAVCAAALLTACSSGNAPEPDNQETKAQTVKTQSTSGVIAPNPDRNAYFGDLHIHTQNSFDAYIFNIRATPDDAYGFGPGKPITHPLRYEIQLDGPPLDFMAVTDHIEYMRMRNEPIVEITQVKGTSDTHLGGGAFDEERFWSKIGVVDGTPAQRGSVPPGGAKTWDGVEPDRNAEHRFSRRSAAGLI